MTTKLPGPIPQIPVGDLERAIGFYRSRLGFTLDWNYEDSLAGISRNDARLFLSLEEAGSLSPVSVWLNLASIAEVDALYREWRASGVPIPLAPELKPWKLYEFIAEDIDGNAFRVFHDTQTPRSPETV